MVYLRILSLDITSYILAKNQNSKISSISNTDDNNISITVLFNEDPLFKNAYKITKMKNNELLNEKKNVLSDEDFTHILEELFLNEILDVVKGLAQMSILKLPHLMDVLALLGDNNIILSTTLLTKLHEILKIKTIINLNINATTNIQKINDGKEGKQNGNTNMNINGNGKDDFNPVFGTQLEKIVAEVEVASRQVYAGLAAILSTLSNDNNKDNSKDKGEEEDKTENNNIKNKIKLKSVDLSDAKNSKDRRIEEKLKTEKRILELQSTAKNSNNLKNQKSLQLFNISDKIIDQYVDLVLYLVDIVYSFSVFLQSAAMGVSNHGNDNNNDNENGNGNNNEKNILSLSCIFCNYNNYSPGYFLSQKTGLSLITTLQYIYEEVRK